MDGHETPDGFKGAGGQVSLLALLTAKGDLLTHDGTGLATLHVGAATQVLTVDPLAPCGIKWAAPAAVGGTLAATYNLGAVAADQTMTVATAHGGGITILGHATATADVALTVDGQTYTDVAGTRKHFALAGSFAPIAGNADYHHADLTYTVNQTGGANGTVTGIYLRATETAVVGVHNLIDLGVAAASRFKVDRFGSTTIAQSAATSGLPTALTVTGGAHTGMTASSEDIGAYFNFSANKTWAAGNIALQREVVFTAPTYTIAGGASTIADAATVTITGAPIAGAGTAITNPAALWVNAGVCRFDGAVYLTDGLVGTPALTFTSDPTCGIYHSGTGATGKVLLSINGAPVLNVIIPIGGTGQLVIGGATAAAYYSCDVVINHPLASKGLNTNLFIMDGTTKFGTVQSGSDTWSLGFTLPVTALGTPALTWDILSNVRIGGAAAGATAAKCLVFTNTATAPTTSVNLCHLYCANPIGSLAALAIYQEAPLVSGNLPCTLNGTTGFLVGADSAGSIIFVGALTEHATNVAGSPYNVAARDYYLECRTLTGGGLAITANLPALVGVNNGRIIVVGDSDYNAVVSNITIHPNGANKINNINADYIINVSGTVVRLKANTTTGNWEIC